MLEYIAWGAIIHGLLLGAYLILKNQGKSHANKSLGWFLVVLMVEAMSMFLPSQIGGIEVHYFTWPEVFLFFPVFFVDYFVKKINRHEKIANKLYVIRVAALVVMGISFIQLLLQIAKSKTLEDYFGFDLVEQVYLTQMYVAYAASLISIAFVINQLRSYSKDIEQTRSNILLSHTPWLKLMAYAVLSAVGLWGVEIARLLLGGSGTSNFAYILWVAVFIFIYYASYISVNKDDLPPSNMTYDSGASVSVDSGLDQGTVKEIIDKLSDIMIREKLYRNVELTLPDVSKMTQIPSRKISVCLNQHKNQNFSEFVNSFRVDEAIELLNNPEMNNLTIEGIGKSVGFQSRSAMYVAFKRIKGATPGKFKLSFA